MIYKGSFSNLFPLSHPFENRVSIYIFDLFFYFTLFEIFYHNLIFDKAEAAFVSFLIRVSSRLHVFLNNEFIPLVFSQNYDFLISFYSVFQHCGTCYLQWKAMHKIHISSFQDLMQVTETPRHNFKSVLLKICSAIVY